MTSGSRCLGAGQASPASTSPSTGPVPTSPDASILSIPRLAERLIRSHGQEKLTDAGDAKAQRCGWLKDRCGVSWQVVPSILHAFMSGPDAGKSQRVMQALLKMKKLDIDELQRAYEGRSAS